MDMMDMTDKIGGSVEDGLSVQGPAVSAEYQEDAPNWTQNQGKK